MYLILCDAMTRIHGGLKLLLFCVKTTTLSVVLVAAMVATLTIMYSGTLHLSFVISQKPLDFVYDKQLYRN